MKKHLLTIALLVLAAGASAIAQSPFPDQSAPIDDSSRACAILRPAQWKTASAALHPTHIGKAKSTVVSARPLIPVDWQLPQLDQGTTFHRAFQLEPYIGFQRSFHAIPIPEYPTLVSSKTQQDVEYTPPTGGDRAQWMLKSSFGWKSLAVGAVVSGWKTAFNKPEEWGGTWEGFGKRFGTRQAGVTMSSSLEASLGSIWGEDPRYLPSSRRGFWPRASYALKTALLAHDRNGKLRPAYARYIGIVASNFITNTWRPPSDNTWDHALIRSGWGISGRMFSNMFNEFRH